MHSNFTMSHWINRVATAFSSSCVTTKKHGYFSLDEKFSKGFLIMMFLIGFTVQSSFAQVSGYSFAQSTDTYAQITGTTSTATGDDGTQTNISIGFTFNFGGTDYTAFGISTNGIIRLGSSSISSGWTNSLGNSATLRPLITPFWDDNNLSTGTIRYTTTGTAPNRILTVNWHNFKAGDVGSTAGASISTLVRLYETTNVIEFVYGSPFTTTNSVSASVGINDSTSFLSVTPAATSTVSSSTANNSINASAMANLAGKKLTFTPPAPPACALPSSLIASAVTSDSATISWTAPASAPSNGYEYEVRTSGLPGTGGASALGSPAAGITTANVTALASNTTYSFYVRSNCGGDGYSDWSGAGTFTTLCDAETAPTTTQTFATFTGSAPNPSCWSEATGAVANPSTLTTANSEWFSGNFANTGSNTGVKTNLYSTNAGEWIISQPIDLGGTAGLYRVKYNMAVTSYNVTTAQPTLGTHIVRVIVSTDGGSTWNLSNTIKTYTGAGTYSNTGQIETVNLTGFSGVVKIAFVATTSSTSPDIDFHIDDFVVEAIPSCIEPTDALASLITSDTATISWTAPGSAPASGYEYEVRTSGAPGDPGATIASTTAAGVVTANLTGLDALTTYSVYVRSNCDVSGFSVWTTGITFSTLCQPEDLTPVDGSRCGPGEVELTASATGGATINWYADAVGGTSLGTGDSFITPTILSSTTFYADVTSDGLTTNGGKSAPEVSWSTFTGNNYGIVFNVLSAGTLNAVDVYSTSAGTLTVYIIDSAQNTLFTTSAIAVANGGTTTPTTIPINFDLPVGTGYRILVSSFSGVSLVLGSTSLSFPYTDSNLSVTSGATSTTGTTTGFYYYYHNLDFTAKCVSSPRQAVLAEITASPVLTLSAAPAAVCASETTTAVTITSDVADYDTYEWSPATNVSGDEFTGWTFNPSETTEYTLTASDSGGSGCTNVATVTITILPTLPTITIDNADATICSNEIQTLTVTGGQVEDAEFTNDSGAVSLAIPDNSLTTGVVSNLVVSGVPTSATITTVEIGLNITHTWNSDMRINLEGPNGEIINLVNQVAGSGDNFSNLIITSDNTAATLPTTATTNLTGVFKASLANQGTIGTTPAVTSTSFAGLFDTPNGTWKLRLYDDANGDTGTLTNWSIKIIYNYGEVLWSPTNGLFTDDLATVPYNGVDHALTLYANPSADITYTATATGDCGSSDTVSFVVDTAPTTADAGTSDTYIDGDVITLGANNPAVGTGAWTVFSGPSTDVAQFGNAAVHNTSFNHNGGMGTYVLRWTISNGVCSVSTSDVSITIEPVKWSGGAWNNITGPIALVEAEIDGDYVSADDGGSITVKNLTITPTSTLTISTGDVLTIAGALINEATVNDVVIESGAYLHQTSDDANTGSITIKRATNIKRLDISLWSSPVDAQNLLALSPQTLTNRFFGYDEEANNWTIFADVANETMVPAAGYGVRAPNNWPVTLTSFTGVFKGVPNNGDYTQAFTSDHATANYNLVGNPYPSVLDLRAFYTANTGKILNTVYFFEHTITPGTGGGQTNYGTLTIAPDAADNVYVPASSSPNLPNIAAIQAAEAVEVGQGFFVRAVPGESGNLDFNNAMRKTTPGVFFRNATTTLDNENEVTSKFRLEMTSPEGFKNQTVVGYYDYASNDLDMMDAQGIGSPLYTILSGKKLASQGFGLPFNQGQVIPLGGNFEIAGEYSIALHSAQGIFETSQYVLIHDNVLGIYHNLLLSPYSFEASGGINDARFEIVFTSVLSSENPDFVGNSVVVYEINDVLQAQVKGNTLLESIQVVDLSGKILFEQSGINTNLYNLNTIRKTETILLVTTTTKEGLKQTQKIFY